MSEGLDRRPESSGAQGETPRQPSGLEEFTRLDEVFEEITTEKLCEPPEPYSYALRAGDTVYLAGQVALDAHGNTIGSTVAEQAAQVWENIAAVLEAAGGSLANVIKITYYLQDIRELAEEMPIRRRLFSDRPLPVVTAVQVAALGRPGLKMEVDVIAVIPS